MKRLIRILLVLLFLFLVSCNANSQESEKLQSKALAAETFCKAHGMNLNYCFLIDMSIHSGKNRFFVWNFKKKKVEFRGLVCHGVGGGSTGSKPVFSNVVNSGCTSLGKYKVGVKSYSKYGINIHYKLHGLDSTNSQAFKRIIVLHSFDPVPAFPIYPAHLYMGMSLGCPVVSNSMMRKLDTLLIKEKKSVLLWIYN
jgi:hypothetical protein